MSDERVVFGRPLIGAAEVAEVADSLRSGWVGTGPKVARFERALEQLLAGAHVRCVSSGSAALFLALRGLGVEPGDEVLLPAMTFVATANVVEHLGARPVLVDSEPGSGLIDLGAAEAAAGPAARALVVVHLAGLPVDLVRARELCRRRGLALVEDAAHALGAELDGRPIGAWGDPAAFSFSPGKNITSLEGGALATADAELADRVERLARQGLGRSAWERFAAAAEHELAAEAGYKMAMTDVQASVALHQLPLLEEWAALRERQWARYDQALSDLPLDLPPGGGERVRHARHLYRVAVRDAAPQSRDELRARLDAAGIGTGIHYHAIHLHPYYRDRYGLRAHDFPHAEEDSRRTLSLPLGPALSDGDQERVVAAVRRELVAGS